MYKVMIVDDEKFIRKSIRNRMDWKKYGITEIEEAGNGEEALKLLTYDNLSLTSTYLKVNEEGIVEMTAEEMERQIQIAILLPIYAMAL